jgi:geranylgeranyl pyrophosphate synthase
MGKVQTIDDRLETEILPLPRPDAHLPRAEGLREILSLKAGRAVNDLLNPVLFAPIRDLTDRPSKKIRGQLVEISYQLVTPMRFRSAAVQANCWLCAQIVELVHAGSLVVDDIQDGSVLRRGQPALHRKYGLPVALNAGNWLYFWPLQLLRNLDLPVEKELVLYRAYHRTLLRAHFGQALDVGVHMDTLAQHRVLDVCYASMELKTGALIALASVMGGVLGGASEKAIAALEEFGQAFGVALQMFDDLGNLSGRQDPGKRFEDLGLRRPSWVWACAAEGSTKNNYEQFIAVVKRLPETGPLEQWLAKSDLGSQARSQAQEHLARSYEQLRLNLGSKNIEPIAFQGLRALGERVAEAYD